MLRFLVDHLPTIVVGAMVALALGAVAWSMIKDRRSGKSSCGCHCANCPSAGMCHKKHRS